MKQALIFANGEPNDGPMVRRALRAGRGARIIGADGGALVAEHFGLLVDSIIGDMDSLTAEQVNQFEGRGATIVRHPAEKDATDLELALIAAAEDGCDWIRVVGGLGGRFDQALANVYLLALTQLEGCNVELVAGKQAIRLLRPGTHELTGKPDDTLSLIPVGGDVRGITTRNLKYPLNDETLRFGPARGVSNVMETATAEITIAEGILMCVHTIGRA